MTETSTQTTTASQIGPHTPGAFVWHELRTKDTVKAQQFYTALFGWTVTKSEVPGMDYHLFHLGGKQIGGLFNSTGHEMAAHWGSFISVPDVDMAAAAAKDAGGQLCAGPDDIPGVGRFAMISDPQGAFVALYKQLMGDPDTSHSEAGEFCWDQLNTTDMTAGAAFYEKVIGWTAKQPTPDMGVFKFGDSMEASLGIVPPGVPAHWMPFILVDNLVDATQKAETLGATVLMGNIDTGDFGRYSIIQDPVGAHIALFQGNAD
jgi:predicted enzyme related to lactoylglutathione lyase